MKRNNIVIVIMTAILCGNISAQTDFLEFADSAKATVERGNLVSDIGLLTQGRSMLERALAMDPDNLLLRYHLAYAEYRVLIDFLYTDHDDFNAIAEQCEQRLENILRAMPGWSEAQALLSGVYGLTIAKDWTRAMTVGPIANRLAQEAVDSDPNNPRAWLMHGSQKINTPRMFGGSIDDAVQAFERSIELFENHTGADDPLQPEWGYTDALAWLGIAYQRQERYTDALSVLNKALDVEPDFAWVKYNLLPELEKSIAGQ